MLASEHSVSDKKKFWSYLHDQVTVHFVNNSNSDVNVTDQIQINELLI